MEPLPLIVAGYDDPHVAIVLEHLRKEGVVPLVLNRAALPQEHIVNRCNSISIGGRDISGITTIWYRRSMPLILPETMEDRWIQWCEQEFSSAFLGALYQCDAVWINDPFSAKKASLKALQLQVASNKLGLKVPDYVVTSCPEEAERFVRQHGPDDTVIKPLGRPVVGGYRTGASTIFTNSCTTIQSKEWSQISFCPSILQQRIHRVSEVRVTVVGSDVFAAEIDVSETRDSVDYRTVDPYGLPHRGIELPDNVEASCLAMMEFFGLKFAALDFLRDQDGALYFTEINPSAQWLWIEELTGLPISKSMASLLIEANKPDGR